MDLLTLKGLFLILGLCLFVACSVVFILGTVNLIHWLCIQRDKLRIEKATARFKIESLKREHSFYDKHL